MAKKKTTARVHRPAEKRAAGSSSAPANGKRPPASGSGRARPSPAPKPAATAKGTATAKPAATPKRAATVKPAATVKTGGAPVRPGPTKAERLAAAEEARRRRALRTRALIAGGVALSLLVVGFLFVSNRRDREKAAAPFETISCKFDTRSDGDAGAGRNHVSNPTYDVDPPAGGNHSPTPAPAGVYTVDNAPPDGQLVHSLEHGYVIFWYRPDIPADELAVLQEVAKRHARDVLVVPRASMGTPVAATAWHARILCGVPEGATLERFVEKYANQGPEAIPH